jgi:hypothetical protein
MSVSPICAAPSVRFAMMARALTEAARSGGWVVPGFRSPPRIAGTDRAIRRASNGVVVSIRVKGRPFSAVVADMIEGIVVTNELCGAEAGRCRSCLWERYEVHLEGELGELDGGSAAA